MPMCTHVEVTLGLLQESSTIFLRQSLSRPWGSQCWLDWMISTPQGSIPPPYVPSIGVTHHAHSGLCVGPGDHS